MFTKSIRWRIQLWLAFLLVCVLTGFGATVYQLYRLSYFDQLDEELARRVSSLNQDLRGGRPGGPAGKPPPFDDHEGRPFRGPDHRGGPGDMPPFDRRGGRP